MTPLHATDDAQAIAHQTAATASGILALTCAVIIGIIVGIVIAVSRIASDDDRAVKRTRHQRDPHEPGPSARVGTDWIPGLHPARARGQLEAWTPDDDTIHFPLDQPAEIDWRKGDDT